MKTRYNMMLLWFSQHNVSTVQTGLMKSQQNVATVETVLMKKRHNMMLLQLRRF